MSGAPHVIEIDLNAPAEMFELAPTELFSEYRNHLTGVEMCLSDLRSHAYRRPVKVVVSLPEPELTPHTADDIARTPAASATSASSTTSASGGRCASTASPRCASACPSPWSAW